jgi:trigger factor
MQVSVEKVSDLERKLTVQLPSADIDSEVSKRLVELTKTAKIDGFRKGKVPVKEVERRYGDSVRQEVLGEMIQRSFFEAVNEQNLKPAGMPSINSKVAEQGKDFEYEATFEVYPELELPDFAKLNVEKQISEISEEDIQRTIDAVRKQHVEWHEVDRASQNGDQVIIDFDGSIDGEKLDKGDAKEFTLELGSKSMIPGFEDALLGAKAGDELTIHPTFPEDYHAEHLAGKKVDFAIKVHKVNEAKLPELNDEFAKKLNIKEGTAEKLRAEVHKNMQRELEFALMNKLKQHVMDGILEISEVPVPKALIDAEIQKMQQHLMQQLGGKTDIQTFADKSTAIFEEQATRRVKLGLLIGEYIKQNDIKVDEQQVKAHIEKMAEAYEKPDDVVRWYYSDKNRMAEIEAVILEQQVVDKILENAKVTEKSVKFDDVVKQGHQH